MSAGTSEGRVARQGSDRRRIALVLAAFFLQPVAFGAWLPRIPDLRAALALTPSELSLCLLGVPVGIMLVLPVASRIVAALGLRLLLIAGFVVFLAVVPLASWSVNRMTLFLGLMAAGMAMSVLELGLNLTADRVEAATGRHVMNTCHGFWSMGIMGGTLLGSALAWAGIAPHVAVSLVAGAVLLPALWVVVALPETDLRQAPEPEASGGVRRGLPGRLVIGIGLCTLGVTMTEGAIADWSAIYLRDVFDLQSGAAGLGYVVFAGMVTAGRLVGDRLKRRMGAVRLARACVICALAGIGILVAAPVAALAFLGFALAGFGVSVGFPLAVTAVAAVPGGSAASHVATLSFIALLGFMIGPVVIGGLTEWFGLRAGLSVLLVALGCSLALVPLLKPRGA